MAPCPKSNVIVVWTRSKEARICGASLSPSKLVARASSALLLTSPSDFACQGLNLAACNNVILVEPSWNPPLEVRLDFSELIFWFDIHQDQAFDHVHRIGQERPVTIYKLTVPNTVEERIYKV